LPKVVVELLRHWHLVTLKLLVQATRMPLHKPLLLLLQR
jgi:hypothetical protein